MPEMIVRILGDTSQLEKSYRKAAKDTEKFGRGLERAGRGAVVASVGFHGLGRMVGYASASFLGAAGFTAAVKAGFQEMFEGQKVAAQTNAALRSTGRIAGVSARQISTMAGTLQKLTGYDDEAIQSAENLLLTFTNVRDVAGRNNQIFDQATVATLNLSRTFDQDLGASAVQLGHVLQAQKIILREVNRETGNAAKAYGRTLPGQIKILQGNLRNLAGELAKTLNPQIKELTRNFNKWLENPEHKKQIIEDFAKATEDLAKAAQVAAGAFGFLQKVWNLIPQFAKQSLPKLVTDEINRGKKILQAFGIIGTGGKPGNLFAVPTIDFSHPDLHFFTHPQRRHFAAPPTAGLPPPRIPGTVTGTADTPGLRLRLPSTISGAVATPGLVRPPGRVSGAYQFYRASYETPARLDLALSRAQALGENIRPILIAMRRAAYRALHSGRLAIEAQKEAWDAIAGLNDQLKNAAQKAAAAQRRQALQLAGASGAAYQFAYARGGPTIHIEHFYSAASNPRALEDELARRARARAHPRRGAR
jgi:hypothetical protein